MAVGGWACSKCGFTPRPFTALLALEHLESCAAIPTLNIRLSLLALDEFSRARADRIFPDLLREADQPLPRPPIHALFRDPSGPTVAICHPLDLDGIMEGDLINIEECAMVVERVARVHGMVLISATAAPGRE